MNNIRKSGISVKQNVTTKVEANFHQIYCDLRCGAVKRRFTILAELSRVTISANAITNATTIAGRSPPCTVAIFITSESTPNTAIAANVIGESVSVAITSARTAPGNDVTPFFPDPIRASGAIKRV